MINLKWTIWLLVGCALLDGAIRLSAIIQAERALEPPAPVASLVRTLSEENAGKPFRTDIFPRSEPVDTAKPDTNQGPTIESDSFTFNSKKIKLLAISSDQGKMMATFSSKDVTSNTLGDFVQVAEGEQIHGALLQKIHRKTVILALQDESIELKLFESKNDN